MAVSIAQNGYTAYQRFKAGDLAKKDAQHLLVKNHPDCAECKKWNGGD